MDNSRDRVQVFRARKPVSAAVFGLVCLLWALGVGSSPDLAGVLGALAIASVPLLVVLSHVARRPRAFEVDDFGLRRRWWHRPSECWPWSVIRDVEFQGDELRIGTELGDVRAGRDILELAALRDAVCAGLGQREQEPVDDPIQADEVETWLGVPRAGKLACRFAGRAAVLVTAGLIGAGLGFGCTGGEPWAALAGLLLAELGLGWLTRPPIVASGYGISVRRLGTERFYPWSALRQVNHDGSWLRLTTTDGVIDCPDWYMGGPKLRRAADGVLAARREGRAMPREGGLSSAALSRAEPMVSVERGLTRGDP